MRLEPEENKDEKLISSESDFFQRVKKRTYGTIFWERVEPSNECGFPDTHFVVRSRGKGVAEGTVEFKFQPGPGAPKLSGDLVRGSQKSALIDYHQMGGRRRFFLVYADKMVWFYSSGAARSSFSEGGPGASAVADLEEPSFCAWLVSCLTKEWDS